MQPVSQTKLSSTEISREEAVRVFAQRSPGLSLAEVGEVFDLWLDCGCLDFSRNADGKLWISLIEPRKRQ
jgi:hypothetical protein